MGRFMQLIRRIGGTREADSLVRSHGWLRPVADTTAQPVLPFEARSTKPASDRALLAPAVVTVLALVAGAGVLVGAAYERGPFSTNRSPERSAEPNDRATISVAQRSEALAESVNLHVAVTTDYHRWLETLTAAFGREAAAMETALDTVIQSGGGLDDSDRAALRDAADGIASTKALVRPRLASADFGQAREDAGLTNAEGVIALLAGRPGWQTSKALSDLRTRVVGARSLLVDIVRVHDELEATRAGLAAGLAASLEPVKTPAPIKTATLGPSLPVWPVVALFVVMGGLIGFGANVLHTRDRRQSFEQPLATMRNVLQSVESGDHTPRVDVTGRGTMAETQELLNAALEAIQVRVVSRVEHERTVSNLIASHEQTTRRERLAAADELAAGVVADLDERVTSAVGFAEMARRSALSPAMDHDLGALIDQLTEVGRVMRRLTKAPARTETPLVRLDALAAEVADMAKQHVWPKVDVSLRVADGEHLVAGDVGRLRQAVLNLVSNSRAAMPGGGQLWIEVGRMQSAGASDGSLEMGSPVDSLVLRVRDTGRGISQANLGRLFEPFVTTEDNTGAGLGLPQVAGIMAQHGGGVRVESQEGLGTTVSLLFPRAQRQTTDEVDEEAIEELAIAS